MAGATPQEQLIAVLARARELVLRPDNDFMWSSWRDGAHAAAELDHHLAALAQRPVPRSSMGILFAPTGPLQEVAESSGWGDDFIELADRFDAIAMVVRCAVTCSLCGAPAGTIELRDDGELVRDSFTSRLTQTLAQLHPLWDAIADCDSAAVHACDPELAPWWCPRCERAYCGVHWRRFDVFDDEGFHDSIRGTCPAGHERLLED